MEEDVFEVVLKQLEKAQKIRNWPEKELELIKAPKKILDSKLKVKLDNGKTERFQAYRVQHNNARGPTKGGIRYHPNVTLGEVKSLAFWMALKCSITNIPLGGAKGGIILNPKEMSDAELERVSRAFVQAFHEDIGPDQDVPAPDVYTTPQIMVWMLDEYEKITGKHAPAMITGKPLELGGSQVRGYSTAQGGLYVTLDAAKNIGIGQGSRVAIQGYGNAGYFMAKILAKNGYKIVAVSDSKGGIFNENGLDPEQVMAHKQVTKSVVGFEATKAITNEELLELDVEILVPAALEKVITQENAGNVKAKLFVELANGPVTPEADDVLFGKGTIVVPDILANAGGV
ncbi:Glu/Leu/Phe/Val dehydrogenase, partial [Candidatus Woesearchaeota archaeon]|nr:Glu/Leu/Phe/Val dehydrogenase [Candidatus Woesearchaeota archaeon]